MSTDGERVAEVLGDAIAEAVRRAVDEVGRAPQGQLAMAGSAPPGEAPPPAPRDLVRGNPLAEDPYEVLGVGRGAPWAEVEAAHKRLARLWHPDTGGDEDLIRRLNVAYAALKIRRGR
jgi:hypothetical protein